MIYVLLGFLCLRACTQYDMLKALKLQVSPFYQPSLGSIQATLKKLLGEGWVTVEVSEGGRRKNIYRITDEGKKTFRDWMLTDSYTENVSKLDSELSTRLFFLGLMQPNERRLIVKMAADSIDKMLTDYTQANGLYSKKAYPPGYEDVARFQLKTLSLGIHQLASMRDWLFGLYSEMEEMA